MSDLTPYDTGARLEPMPWITEHSAERDPDKFGKVDFDDEEGRTLVTLWIERDATRGYALRIGVHAGPLVVIAENYGEGQIGPLAEFGEFGVLLTPIRP